MVSLLKPEADKKGGSDRFLYMFMDVYDVYRCV